MKGGYKFNKKGGDIDKEVKDELADCLFMLFRIADHYGIDLEQTYLEMHEAADKKLKEKEV